MLVRTGWKLALREKSQKVTRIIAALETVESRSIPQWIELDKETFSGTVMQMPVRDDITIPIDEQLIVELYSR
jgi:small subunit ribosomal protein S4